MEVIVARSAGFCMGVQRAVEKARRLASGQEGPVYTDGALIHNQQMMAQLDSENIRPCPDLAALRDDTLLIRAHGIPPARRKRLQALPCRLRDATCPDVARIQGLIRKHARQGYQVVILGDSGHAEVVGLLGFAEGRGHVIAGPEDVARLPEMEKVCLVSQSTQFPSRFEATAHTMRARYPALIAIDTICDATRHRQGDIVEMADQVDAFVVVGGSHSANTLRLVELARGLKPTVHIQTAGDLQPGEFEDVRIVGLTAGASTPSFIIAEVRAQLEAF
ncbi:MAG: 4-hydroxy-3-methylbut-2-enyl diphosphate reductase [Verrucomicrobia bacterium]|jgi:(E)-4-hydroxy-3-methyl-but-2-enyl pyrophosphate reductase|nr:4-hydroxy-3-methylbut-2-enyl diphosphate reductase [Verrucomicrobiota bacterium]MBT7067275.1 4-hydroxy-3-methylbut-2-enyl diphosphate reductase [Verrucomicrobiota bacterium]MBT7698673.1 4-hydroxy-3-methylbut-2-enyl diphosphate reductase [Verrucomicrobiota bacterium]